MSYPIYLNVYEKVTIHDTSGGMEKYNSLEAWMKTLEDLYIFACETHDNMTTPHFSTQYCSL